MRRRPRVTSTCHRCRIHVSQVSSELEEWALATYGLDRAELSLAACGLKLTSGAPRQALMRTRSFMLHSLLGRGLVSCLPTVRAKIYLRTCTYLRARGFAHRDRGAGVRG